MPTDPPDLLTLRLVSMVALEEGYRVTLQEEEGQSHDAVAHVAVGVDGAPSSASIAPDYFMHWNGTAESMRVVVSAIGAFAEASNFPVSFGA